MKYGSLLEKTAQKYLLDLYEADYLDDFYDALDNLSCTSVRSENFIGRNFD